MTLYWQYFRSQRTGLLVWLGIALLLNTLMAMTAKSIGVEGMGAMLERLPPALVKMMGAAPGLDPVDSYVAMELGTWGGVVIAIYAVMLALGIVTREVDRRTIDFLLAQPVSRKEIMVARIGVMLTASGLLAFVMWAAISAGLYSQGLEASYWGFARLYFNQWLLGVALGSLALLASIWIDDYSLGVKLWLGIVSGSLILEIVLRAVDLSRWAKFFSPFSYVDAIAVVRDGLPIADALVLISVSLTSLALSIPAFERKQISA